MTRRTFQVLPLLFALMCVSCRQEEPVSTPPLQPATQTAPSETLFQDVAEEVGLKFQHTSGATGAYFFPEIMGGGAALLDYDNDGDLDVYLVQSGFLDKNKSPKDALVSLPSDWKPGCRLFRNELTETGKLHFTDITAKAGAEYGGYGMGTAVGDYDNDGYPDLYVTGFGHNALYHNEKNGTFRDVTRKSGTDDPRWSTSASFADYDNDGYLDLVVTNYVDFSVPENKTCLSVSGERDYCGPNSFLGLPVRLLHNQRNGKFRDVTLESGIGAATGAGLGVVCEDFNADGRMDIFVANDGAANHLWLNQGQGKFKESALMTGVALNGQGKTQANMGIALGDCDADGDDDMVITHIVGEGVVFYRNEGNTGFLDATAQAGLMQPTLPFTGFGVEWFDYNNDGWLDLFITNGAVLRMEKLGKAPYPFYQTNQLIRNENEGKTFREVTATAGPIFALPTIGRAAAFGDIDNDGDVDIVVVNNNGPVRLLRNEIGSAQSWLTVQLQGKKTNRMGLGARVAVLRKGQKPLWRRCHTDGSYLSASDPRIHFGLGKDISVEAVLVQWPDGTQERWENPETKRLLRLRESEGKRLKIL